MVKIIGTAVAAAAMLMTSSALAKDKAGDMACCAKNASNQQSCLNLASLNLSTDQKGKIEAWQSECMKAGCTKESRQTFLSRAKGVVSAEQFAQLKAQCKKTANAKKTEA